MPACATTEPTGYLHRPPSIVDCLTAQPASASVDPSGTRTWVPDPADPMRRVPALVHLDRVASPHADVHVWQAGDRRFMSLGSCEDGTIGYQSTLDVLHPAQMAGDYATGLAGALLANVTARRALLIGLGGGVVPRLAARLLPDLSWDAVELNPGVVAAARRWFGLDDLASVRTHVHDGRSFVRHALSRGERWDVVMLDAFDELYVPPSLMTHEFYAEVQGVLEPGGLFCVNVHARGPLAGREDATLAAVFGTGLEVACELSNRVLIAGRGGVMSCDALKQRAGSLREPLATIGFDADWFARSLSTLAATPDVEPLSDDDPSALAALRRSVRPAPDPAC